MKLKQLILGILFSLFAVSAARAQSFFQYPIVPDSITSFNDRCDYLADNFWNFCDLSKAFSAKSKMADEFRIYLKIIANAHEDKAVPAITAFMKKLDKQPKDQLFLASVAEGAIYADTAELWADALYLPITQAVADNKRISKAEKARFAHQAEVLAGSLSGKKIASVPLTLRDGTATNLLADSCGVTVVFFNDPDCSDCAMARIRLHADTSMSELIEEGRLRIVSVSLADPDADWREVAAGYPSDWVVAASPDADLAVDLRFGTPDFYILDKKNNIRFKHLSVDQVIDVARQLKKR